MEIAFFINTPAQAHFFKNIIRTLEKKGHQVKILARNYGETLYLLNVFSIPYFVYADIPKSKYEKILLLPYHILSAHHYLKKSDIGLVVGSGIYSLLTSFLLKKPNIQFIDAISANTELNLIKRFADAIITPSNFTVDIGEKHIKINSFKELSYLHPNYYKADKTVLNLMNINEGDPFALLRFNAFDSTHDFGLRGFSSKERRIWVNELKKYGKVFISSEAFIPEDLSEHTLRIPKEKIHDVLYYSTILIADTGTMVTEAALLGTPAICHHPKAKAIGNFIELEQRYGLIFSIKNPKELIEKATHFFIQKDVKKEWGVKRERLIKEKVDITRFMVWFIEHFPESFKIMKERPFDQERFNAPVIE